LKNRIFRAGGLSLGLLTVVFICFAPGATGAFELPDLLPEDGAIEGWVRAGDYKYPQTADSLQAVINGAADLFLRHDFKGAVFQDYMDTSFVLLSLAIYDQTSPDQAKAVYDSTALGTEEPVGGLGDEARMDEHLFDFQIEFRRGEFYVKGTVMNRTNPYKTALRDFMIMVDGRMVAPVPQQSSWGQIKARHR